MTKSYFYFEFTKLFFYRFSLLLFIVIFLISCGQSEAFKQRKQQTESFINELNFDPEIEPEQLISQINQLISKYPDADPKVKIVFLEYAQWLDEVNQQPSWWSRAGQGAIKGAMGVRKGPLGIVTALYDSWQDDRNFSDKQKELMKRWEKISLNLDELVTYLEKEYDME